MEEFFEIGTSFFFPRLIVFLLVKIASWFSLDYLPTCIWSAEKLVTSTQLHSLAWRGMAWLERLITSRPDFYSPLPFTSPFEPALRVIRLRKDDDHFLISKRKENIQQQFAGQIWTCLSSIQSESNRLDGSRAFFNFYYPSASLCWWWWLVVLFVCYCC